MNAQLDMFGREKDSTLKSTPLRAPRQVPLPAPLCLEDMARALEQTGAYRVIRKLVPPPLVAKPRPGFPRIGVVVDTETTGLNHRSDEVIEIGAVSFTFADDGTFGDVIGIYGGLQ